MPDFGIMRGFNEKLFGDKLVAGQLPTQLGIIGSQEAVEFDVDAQAFFNRVTTAGGSLSLNEKNETNQLVLDMKSAGIWSSMKAIYPMVGASAAACAQNLKSSSFTGTFSSGWTFASTGVTPNGTSAYMNTGLVPNSALTLNSTHLSYYSRTNVVGGQVDMGLQQPNAECYLVYSFSGSAFKALNRVGAVAGSAYTPTTGLLIGNRPNSTTEKYYHKGTLIDTVTVNSNSLSSYTISISGYNTGSSTILFNTKETAFNSIGDGLTDTQASNLYTAVQAFQTTLSRQV